MLLMLLVILALFFCSSQALTCYECDSNEDPACADPVDETELLLNNMTCTRTEEDAACKKTRQDMKGVRLNVTLRCVYFLRAFGNWLKPC